MANTKVTKKDMEKYLADGTIPNKLEGKFKTETDYLKYLLENALEVINELEVRVDTMEKEMSETEDQQPEPAEDTPIAIDLVEYKKTTIEKFLTILIETSGKYTSPMNTFQFRQLLFEATSRAKTELL